MTKVIQSIEAEIRAKYRQQYYDNLTPRQGLKLAIQQARIIKDACHSQSWPSGINYMSTINQYYLGIEIADRNRAHAKRMTLVEAIVYGDLAQLERQRLEKRGITDTYDEDRKKWESDREALRGTPFRSNPFDSGPDDNYDEVKDLESRKRFCLEWLATA